MSTSDTTARLSRLSAAKRALLEKRLQSRMAQIAQAQAIQPRSNRNGNLPLSFAQQRLWFIDQLDPASFAYNMTTALRLTGALDVNALERCLNEIVHRHEALRTTFTLDHEQQPVQVIAPELKLTLRVEDLSQLPEAERESEAVRLATDEAQCPFDLSHDPLLRARLLRLSTEDHALLFTMHHIISDGWSMGVLVREVGAIYSAYARGEESPLEELPIQYADYAVWQREWLGGEVLEEQLSYWKKQLGGHLPVLSLPVDHPRPPIQTFQGGHEVFVLAKDLSDELKRLSHNEDATLFMTLLAAFQVLLHRHTGQEDILVGAPIANRSRPETEPLIGFFVNTLVLRSDLSGNPTFRELLRRVQKMALGAYAHQDLPFEKLVEELHPDRDLSRNPLVQVIFALQNMPIGELNLHGLTIRPQEYESNVVRLDMEFHLDELPDGLGGVIAYNTDLFEKATIRRLLDQFKILLEGIVSNPDRRIRELPLLTSDEREHLLSELSYIDQDALPSRIIDELVEAQVERTDMRAYILDELLEPVPVGVSGELYLGGSGLARSYLQHPELTAEKFIPHPFSLDGGERLYRTGDLARFGAEGKLEFVGRVGERDAQESRDAQLKRETEAKRFIAPRTPVEELLTKIWCEVLNVETIGIDDNFFDLGGHSLLAMQLISRVRKSFSIDLPVRSLFESPTVEALAERIEEAMETGKAASAQPLVPVSREGALPLSFAQQRLWFIYQLEPGSSAYNIPIAVRLKGRLDFAPLERSLSDICKRHESLRTSFRVSDGQPVQIIAPPAELALPLLDLSHLPDDERLAEAERIATAESRQAFDLECGPLYRAALLRLDEDDHILLFTMHHIISDGWSMGVLVREVVALYSAYALGKESPLAPLPLQYADYAAWQRKVLEGEALEAHVRYWEKQLGGTLPVIELPTDRPRPSVQSSSGASQSLFISASLLERLKALSRREGVTLFMLLLAAFKAMLHRYSGQEDIIVGTPVANRDRLEVEGLIGFFVNTLVLRTDLSGSPTFRDLLKRVRTVALEAYAHQDMPFEQLVEHLQPERSANRHPIFQVMFQLENAPVRQVSLPGLTLLPVDVERTATQFDLSMDLLESTDGLIVVAEYSTDLFNAETVALLLEHFQNMLEGISDNEDARLAQVPLLTPAEKEQLLVGWNNAAATYPVDGCLHELFEAQVKRTPESLAVEGGNEKLTYAALNSRANQLAHYLRRTGVRAETRVGVLIERSPEMIRCLLAVLKAGGAYVPLDPRYPGQRLAFMLEDAQVSVLLTQGELKEVIPGHQAQVVGLDVDSEEIAHESTLDPELITTGDNLAYVIYTSGSTGQPKGVGVTHKSLVNHQASVREIYGLCAEDRVLQFASLSFDVAAEEIFPTLLCGATLVLPRDETPLLIAGLLRQIEERGLTLLNLPASAWHEWTDELSRSSAALPDCLRLTVVGSEPVSRESFAAWQQAARDHTRLVNAYGATETTITATLYQPQAGDQPVRSSLPIGRPIANTRVYILDSFLQPVPLGGIGELHIGGSGLARGYLNRPDLTAEKFIPDPFSREPGARLYNTGDLSRYMPDGNLVFLGRSDTQVKIRGLRIELGEIEAVLSEHETVRHAVVAVRHDGAGHNQLVAYIVVEHDRAVRKNELRELLRERLPEFMVPSIFVLMDELPLLPNGKIDRRALPESETVRAETEAFLTPRSEVERAIATVWQEVLRLEKVGVNDNFFDLGGHSLLMMRVHNRLRKALDANLTMLDLFKYPTISSLAAYIAPEQTFTQPQSRSFETEARKEQARQEGAEIAIVGMSGRFPGASSIEEFWQNLVDGTESISFFSDEELIAAGVDAALLNHPNYVKAAVLLDDVDQFDASFFGYSPREAEVMDPQHRIFLECAWEALESAGYNAERFNGAIGVFAGASTPTYIYNLLSRPEIMDAVGGIQLAIGNDKDHMPTHVSYKLNLRGPSVAVQTACSTSLVAVHMACRSLLHNECSIALAGGVALHSMSKAGYVYNEGGIASPDGHCRAFDADAQGTISGSGAGCVVLKRLTDALADGDFIHAVIRGSAINNDGSAKVGYTAPSIEGQAEAIRAAQSVAGVDAESISYIEAHGTGTRLGDPIEIAALTQVFRETTNAKGFCGIGSLKTNLGHLDTAAGVAGLIKTALALQHKTIPPSLHFKQPNPALDLDNSPFYVNKDLSEWKTDGTPRRAGVSSFGIGGTNAHVIVEEAPFVEPSSSSRPWHLLMLSAKTEPALEKATANLAEYLKEHAEANLADVAYTLQVGRKTFNHRRVVLCRESDDAQTALTTLEPERVLTFTDETHDRHVAFMFPGQGTQYVNMGLELYRHEPLFRTTVDECCELLRPHLGFDLLEILYPAEEKREEAARQLQQTHVTQPALFVIEYSLARVWMEWGISPRAMIGHSLGEYVAACLAGVFSLEDALSLIALRGRLIQSLPAGEMLSVQLSPDELRPLLGEHLSLAAVNGPSLCVASGTSEAIDELQQRLAEKDVSCRRLRTSHAFHSQMMNPIVAEFTEYVKRLTLNAPLIPYVSNVTGTWITSTEATDPDYWARHLRRTVRFADGISELLKDANLLMLEVGPGQTLSSMVRPLAREHRQLIINSLGHQHDGHSSDEEFLMKALGRLWLAGARINWTGFYSREVRRRVPLPTYPFERRRYWVEWQKHAVTLGETVEEPRKKPDVADWFYLPFWKPSAPPVITEASARAEQPPVWLVFSDECGFSARLMQKLEESGGSSVIAVRPGEGFDRTGDRDYTISVSQPEDYEALVLDLKERGLMPEAVLHAWSIGAPENIQSSLEFSERVLRRSFYSLIYLARSLGQHNVSNKISITILSDHMQSVNFADHVVPEKATLLGPSKVIPKEYPNLACRSIDVVLPEKDSRQEGRLLTQITSELLSDSREAVVAYRAHQRFVQAFEPVRFERVPGAATPLKEAGVYLITGGLGGIGLALAEHLAQTHRAKLVLLGRSAFPAKEEWHEWLSAHEDDDETSSKIHRMRAMENLGAQVLVASADVSDENQMREVWRAACAEFGKIDGVIHSAGISPGGMIASERPETTASVLAAKVKGTRVLEELCKDEEPDFLALFSSLSSVLGIFGQVDYCAANAFLDAFTHYNRRESGTPTVTINWDSWRDVGMAAKTGGLPFRLSEAGDKDEKEVAGDAKEAQSFLVDAISTAEGIDAFERIVSHDELPRVLVSTRDLQSMIRDAEALTQSQILKEVARFQQSRSAHPRPDVQTAYVAPRNELEEQIAMIWQSVLGIEQVGVHDNFFDLGGHSLLATQLVTRLREIFEVEVPLRVVFEHPTVAGLAEHVIEDEKGTATLTARAPTIVPVKREARTVKRPRKT